MTTRDDDLRVRPGRIRHGNQGAKRPKTFVGEVMRAAKKAGHRGNMFGRSGGSAGRSTFGRGRRAALSLSSRPRGRRVVIMTRIVRHQGSKFRSAPLSRHVAYLKREWARTMVLSIIAYSLSASAERWRKTLSQTPDLAHRLKR